jgi:hypothetical protein
MIKIEIIRLCLLAGDYEINEKLNGTCRDELYSVIEYMKNLFNPNKDQGCR